MLNALILNMSACLMPAFGVIAPVTITEAAPSVSIQQTPALADQEGQQADEIVADEAPADLTPPQTGVAEPRVEPRAAAPVAFAGVSDEELFSRAADSLGSIDTLQARFLQIAPSGNVAEGDLAIRRPGQLRFDYDDPSPQLIVATNGLVYVHDAELETTDSYPVNETPLKFLLSRKVDLEAAELRDVMRLDDRVTIIIASSQADVEGELALVFAEEDFQLLGWGVREPNGAVTTVELDNVKTGVRLNNRLFRAPDAGGTFLRDR